MNLAGISSLNCPRDFLDQCTVRRREPVAGAVHLACRVPRRRLVRRPVGQRADEFVREPDEPAGGAGGDVHLLAGTELHVRGDVVGAAGVARSPGSCRSRWTRRRVLHAHAVAVTCIAERDDRGQRCSSCLALIMYFFKEHIINGG